MNDIENILELLDKDFLTDEENLYLANSLKNPEIKDIKETYVRLKNLLNRSGHINEELMAEYVLYKNNLSSEKLIVLLSPKIEDHLRECSGCRDYFKELNSEYLNVDNFINDTITTETKEKKYFNYLKLNLIINFRSFKYASVTIVSIIIIYFALLFVSTITTPDYKKSLLDGNEFYTSRGRTSESFQRGLNAIDNKRFDDAIKYLNEDIASSVDDETLFYSYFILGITYIDKAESDYLGLFKTYNKEDVIKGIDCFNKSIKLNKSGNFNNLILDAHYYIAKAYLLIDDIISAKEELKIVVQGKGSYYKKAEELLKIL